MTLYIWTLAAALFLSLGTSACQPRTPTEKAKDKIEDATHEAGQGIERAGDRVKDAAK